MQATSNSNNNNDAMNDSELQSAAVTLVSMQPPTDIATNAMEVKATAPTDLSQLH
jgi:hypothetical protein